MSQGILWIFHWYQISDFRHQKIQWISSQKMPKTSHFFAVYGEIVKK